MHGSSKSSGVSAGQVLTLDIPNNIVANTNSCCADNKKKDKEMEKKTNPNPEVVWDLYENCHLAEFREWPDGFAAIEYSDDIDNPKSS